MLQAADSLVVKAQRLTKRFGDRVAVKAITLLITPMFIFSGVFYPVEALPGWTRCWSRCCLYPTPLPWCGHWCLASHWSRSGRM